MTITLLNELVLMRIPYEIDPAVKVELVHQVRAVRFNGANADAQRRGNLAVGMPVHNEAQNLQLA